MPEELKRLAQTIGLRRESAAKLVSGGRGLSGSLQIDPCEFLQQAEDDLEAGGSSARLNAITNARRAIQSQVDQILLCFGFQPNALKTRRKLSIFADLGFVAPRMLRRVSDARNLLEHEYQSPTQSQVEEAVDLASLFVETTQRYITVFEGDFCVGNEEDQLDSFNFSKQLDVSYDGRDKCFQVWGRVDVIDDAEHGRVIGKMIVKPGDPSFNDLVRLAVAGGRFQKVKRALDRFLSRLEAP